MIEDDEFEPKGFFARHATGLIMLALVLVTSAVGYYLYLKMQSSPRSAQSEYIEIMPVLPPPPPPPPPTPPPTPPPEAPPPPETEVEQDFVPEDAPTEAADDAPADDAGDDSIGTNVQGDGPPDGFGLTNRPGGGRIGGSRNVGAGGSRWGQYAGQVQLRIAEALRGHRKTRASNLSIQVRIWADASGRVTRAVLEGSSGNPSVDSAIRDEILTNLRLHAPPPEGMPMPIVMRITAKRPN